MTTLSATGLAVGETAAVTAEGVTAPSCAWGANWRLVHNPDEDCLQFERLQGGDFIPKLTIDKLFQ